MNTHDKSCPLRRIIYVYTNLKANHCLHNLSQMFSLCCWFSCVDNNRKSKVCTLFPVQKNSTMKFTRPQNLRAAYMIPDSHKFCHVLFCQMTNSWWWFKTTELSNKSIIKHSADKSWHRGNHFVHVFLSKIKSKQTKIKDKEILLPE